MVFIWTGKRARSHQHSGLVFFTLTIQAVGQPTRYVTDIIYFIWLIQILVIHPSYVYIFGHHDPSSGKPLGHFQVLVSRNTNHHGLCINRSQKVEQVFTISKHHKTCSMAWQIKEFLLSYYKKLQNGSNWVIVFQHWHTIAGKLAAGLRCFVWTAWQLRIILCNHFFFIPPQTLEINRWLIDSS